MPTKATRTLTLLGCTLLDLSAVVQDSLPFKEAVMARFNARDMELMQAAMDATLHDRATNAQRGWRNDHSGASGSVKSIKAYATGTMA